jgi:hypothetical protein
MVYLGNAFSLNMLNAPEVQLKVSEISLQEAKNILSGGFISAVGHQATADILSKLLDIPVLFNRVEVKLQKGDVLIVFQLLKRLEEGKVLTEEEIKNLPYKIMKVEVM